jgi:hypothetical protein
MAVIIDEWKGYRRGADMSLFKALPQHSPG